MTESSPYPIASYLLPDMPDQNQLHANKPQCPFAAIPWRAGIMINSSAQRRSYPLAILRKS